LDGEPRKAARQVSAATEARHKAEMQREVRKAASLIIRYASAGRWFAQPWSIFLVLQRARELDQPEYVPPLVAVLHDITHQAAARN
jgi:hypothetical protein